MRRMFSEKQIKELSANVATDIIESGQVDNAKPIYCHPVYASFVRDGTLIFSFTCLVFNNDSTPFTAETFFDWVYSLIEEINTASIMASGYVGNNNIVTRICYDSRDNFLALETSNTSTSGTVYGFTKGNLTAEGAIFRDGVNKIN